MSKTFQLPQMYDNIKVNFVFFCIDDIRNMIGNINAYKF